MHKIIRYILSGVAAMASAEFQGNVLLRGNIVNFFPAMALYSVISLIGYLIGKRVKDDLWFYIGGGLLVLALPIPRGGSVAILMTIYSITLSFMCLISKPAAPKLHPRFKIPGRSDSRCKRWTAAKRR